VKLTHDELNVIPLGQLVSRYTHRRRWTVMTRFAQTFAGEFANELHVRFVTAPRMVLVDALVRVSLVRLWMLSRPLLDLILIDKYLAVFDPRGELGQRFARVVLANAGIQTVVPEVHTTDQVVALHEAVGH
jgi:hypothetical protein